MTYDFYANYDFLTLSSIEQSEAIDYLCHVTEQVPRSSATLKDIHDDGARMQILAQALNTEHKERARTGVIKGKPGGLLHWIKFGRAENYYKNYNKIMSSLGIWSVTSKVECLPQFSTFLQFKFTLATPYLSRDDEIFHINENPVRKDKVFKVPMVAASGWKGVLRAALWQLGHKEDNEVIVRLFGNPRESEEGRAGRLYFYPTFFDKIDLEVINPHDRKTGAGARGPILMECVPAGTTGYFTLLYVPFDLIGKEEQKIREQVSSDLALLIKGIQAMFATYGFGAKTSSGFGTAEMVKGSLTIKSQIPDIDGDSHNSQKKKSESDLPRYLEAPGVLHADFRKPDGSLKSEEEYISFLNNKDREYRRKDRQLYNKARKWWENNQKKTVIQELQNLDGETPFPQKETKEISEFQFRDYKDLEKISNHIITHLYDVKRP